MFDYELPPERIAQHPKDDRASSKMMVAGFSGASASATESCQEDHPPPIIDTNVSELPRFLRAGDVLIVNNSKVFPCRFFARKEDYESEIEVLLLSRDAADHSVWECLARPMRKLRPGMIVTLSTNLKAEVLERSGESEEKIKLRLFSQSEKLDLMSLIESEGGMPIPGYIRGGKSDETDKHRYQTVFSETSGSVAAPTAGLHFTEALVQTLKDKGVILQTVTLHVGVASFAPVRDIATHRMPVEWYRIPKSTAAAIADAKADGRRVIAVGTTSIRSLESAAKNGSLGNTEELQPTELFITPGFQFQVIDGMMTNFHQPKTTHLLLVSAFFGEEKVKALYRHALESDYRFLSYGDCMLLLP